MSYDAVQEGTVIARNVSVRVDQADPLKGFTASRRPSLSVRGNMQILTQQHSTANSRYQGAETAHRKETPRERFRGPTPHELAFGRTFSGELCEFGKPVFACVVPATKASVKWKRMLFLGNTQSSLVLFNGQAIVLLRNVRRISTTWRSHVAYLTVCITSTFHGSTKSCIWSTHSLHHEDTNSKDSWI